MHVNRNTEIMMQDLLTPTLLTDRMSLARNPTNLEGETGTNPTNH